MCPNPKTHGPHLGLLLLAAHRPDSEQLSVAVATSRAAGTGALLASYAVPDATRLGDGPEIRELQDPARAHGPAFRRALRRAKPPERFWLHVRDDVWLAGQLPDVTVVLALDPVAGLAAERLADAHVHLRVAADLDEAVALLRVAPAAGPRSKAPDAASAGALLRLRLPGLSAEDRLARAQGAVLALLRDGRQAEAERLVGSVAPRLPGLRERADLLGTLTSWSIVHGVATPLARDSYAAELAVADRHLAAGRRAAAAECYEEALRTAFDATLHFQGLTSPLAHDPAGFTAPLRESTVAQAVRAGRGRRTPAAAAPTDRPTRLLIATRETQAFIGEIRDHFSALDDFETRFVELTELPGLEGLQTTATIAGERLGVERGPATKLADATEQLIRPHLDWADVVLVDWCTLLAGLFTRIDPGETRIVVRLHSYEVFTRWSQLVDFSRVDDLVLVSDHLETLALAAMPGLSEPGAPRRHVLTNAVDLARTVRPKDDDARFTLGLVGAPKIVKDPRWAIEVLRLVRAHDERYRLLLIGQDFSDTHPATRAYAEELARDLAELEPVGAVRRYGQTDDVPGALEQVGVIVSSSVRESFHVGLVEGAASGALPVVRDWPFFPGAAAELFPPDWVVGTPQAAAERILELTTDAGRWRAEATAASAYALAHWDWPVVRGGYEDLLRGTGSGS